MPTCFGGQCLDRVRVRCTRASSSGVLLAQVEEWDPPVPMQIVLSNLEPTAKARADFEAGVVRITAHEYGPSSRRQPGASSSG